MAPYNEKVMVSPGFAVMEVGSKVLPLAPTAMVCVAARTREAARRAMVARASILQGNGAREGKEGKGRLWWEGKVERGKGAIALPTNTPTIGHPNIADLRLAPRVLRSNLMLTLAGPGRGHVDATTHSLLTVFGHVLVATLPIPTTDADVGVTPSDRDVNGCAMG